MRAGENLLDVGEHSVGVEGGVDRPVEAPLGVVLHQREGLLVVRLQSLFQGLRVVVRTPDQRFSSHLERI